MNSIIDNYINGNLTDARRMAKGKKLDAITRCMKEDYGFSDKKAMFVAMFLKNKATFQESCDAV